MSALAAAGIMAGASLLGSYLSSSSNEDINDDNIAFQREINAKNEQLMREGWQRDDTAVQRRARDLAVAGQSPLLAAGSAANPSQTSNMVAARKDRVLDPAFLSNAVQAGLGIVQTLGQYQAQQALVEKTEAETARVHMQNYEDFGGEPFELRGKKKGELRWRSGVSYPESNQSLDKNLKRQQDALLGAQRRQSQAATKREYASAAQMAEATRLMEKQMWLQSAGSIVNSLVNTFKMFAGGKQ